MPGVLQRVGVLLCGRGGTRPRLLYGRGWAGGCCTGVGGRLFAVAVAGRGVGVADREGSGAGRTCCLPTALTGLRPLLGVAARGVTTGAVEETALLAVPGRCAISGTSKAGTEAVGALGRQKVGNRPSTAGGFGATFAAPVIWLTPLRKNGCSFGAAVVTGAAGCLCLSADVICVSMSSFGACGPAVTRATPRRKRD